MWKALYKFQCDFGRMGALEGIFVARPEDLASAEGRRVYFGEVLGKHSEIWCDFDMDDIKVLTDDQEFIAKAESFGLVPMGWNPLHYLAEGQEGDDEEA